MEAADLLCHSLFRWLENRKECADKLLELAQKLEKVNRDGKIAQGFGAAVSVASITGAVVAGVVTEGLAIPLLVATATGSTVVATKVSAIPTLVEAGISWRTFKKVNKLIKEDEEVGTSIQKHLRDLKDRCGGTQLRAHADELECEVTTQLMCALARRKKTLLPLDFLRGFNKATFFRHLTSGGLDPAEASRFICRALNLDSSPEITSSLKVSAKEMMKNIGQIGIKAAVQAGSRVRGATGLGLSLNDLIVKCKEIVKRKRVTEASKFLRDSAREILERQKKLKEQLDAMHEIIQKLFRMRNLIKDLGGYSLSLTENGQNIMAYIMGTCTDSTVVSWLRELTHQIEFVNLLRFVLENLGSIPEDLTRPDGRHIDIVFVAHGSIVDQFMPAGGLVPTPNIIDTILYSPWNCGIDSCAAFGIAHGNIQVTDRVFYNSKPEANNMVYCEPDPLPNHWNSMRESIHNIPGILLSPVTPEERAWAFFHQFWMDRSMEIENRIIIPYLVPQNMVNAFRVIPLYMFIFVTSFILMAQGKTATVHLVACLNRHVGSTPMPEEWRRQYAYTNDGTVMTVNMVTEMNSMLFAALRSLFDSQEP